MGSLIVHQEFNFEYCRPTEVVMALRYLQVARVQYTYAGYSLTLLWYSKVRLWQTPFELVDCDFPMLNGRGTD